MRSRFVLFFRQHQFLIILLLYTTLMLIKLTKLPIFNDEAIYLDWGWRETHVPGQLYFSLYDGKQPLLMWVFGISQSIFSGPLFAGRLISVFTGGLTLSGIYLLAKKYFGEKEAIFSAIAFSLIPLAVFYNRQALMESSLSAINVWTLYFLIQMTQTKRKKPAILAGVILGVGFFIKSTALLFLLPFIICCIVLAWKKGAYFFKNMCWAILAFFCTDLLLFINPAFWDHISSNSRYALTLQEILKFPILTWWHTLSASSMIFFFSFSPMLFLLTIMGSILLFITGEKNARMLLVWLCLTLFFYVLFSKSVSERYLMPFIPLLSLPIGVACAQTYQMQWKGKIALLFCLLLTGVQTGYLLISPASYLLTMNRFTPYANMEYVRGQTSGYGINETVQYLEMKTKSGAIFVGVANNTGNPESAMQVYFQKNPKVTVSYLDSSLLGTMLDGYACIRFDRPMYFVSRENQLAGLDKFFVKEKTVKNPYGTNTIGIYEVKSCSGNVLHLKVTAT